jgi:hypothetical protein
MYVCIFVFLEERAGTDCVELWAACTLWRRHCSLAHSQNDNYNQCGSAAEKAINTAEGTAGGALFRAINVIADAIKDDYPGVRNK